MTAKPVSPARASEIAQSDRSASDPGAASSSAQEAAAPVCKRIAVNPHEHWVICESSLKHVADSVRELSIDQIYLLAQEARKTCEISDSLSDALYACFVLTQMGAAVELRGKRS